MKSKNEFRASITTRLLVQRLKQIEVGQTVTYTDLSDACGARVDGNSSHIRTALATVMRDDRIVFANVRGVGYERLDDVGKVDTGAKYSDRIRNIARKSIETLMCVDDFSGLPAEKKLEHNARTAIMGSIALLSKPDAPELLKSKAPVERPLPVSETLALFSRRETAA